MSWRVILSAFAVAFSIAALICIFVAPAASGRLMAISAVSYGIVALSMFGDDE